MPGPQPQSENASILVEFARYNNWANRLVIEAVQGLTGDQQDTPIPGAFGTIRETLEHIIRGEAGYASLLNGYRPQPMPDWDSNPGLPEIAAYAERVGGELLKAAAGYSPEQVVRQEWDEGPVAYRPLAIWIQIINHGVEHRTNITTALSQMGVTPPDVDGWGNLIAHYDRLGLPDTAAAKGEQE